jgi:hypothetical protein
LANPSPLSEINYEVESSYAEDIDTVATYKLKLAAPVDCSALLQKKIDPTLTVQYRGDLGDWILGTFEPTFKTKMHLNGHEGVTTGAITITALETLLGVVFGNAVTSATGSTLTGGTANIATTTDSGTLDPGDLCFVGALGDGEGEGQCYAVATHSAANLTLLTDLRGAPANGAVRYGGTTIYPSSSATATTLTSVRMHLSTANLQYLVHGCYPTSVAITGLNPGEIPVIEITWAGAWYEYKASTFPSVVATTTANPAATAAGSLWVNTVGTTTNVAGAACRTYRNLALEIDLGVIPLRGPGGVNAYQDIVGCRRTTDSYKLSWSEDADAATTSPVIPGYGTATNRKHALLTLSTNDGSRVAMYFPSLRVTNVASQVAEDNMNRVRIETMAGVGPTTTSALTLSKWRMHFA